MTTKNKLCLIFVPTTLLALAFGSWYGFNMLVARQLPLMKLVEIGDQEGVEYVVRWDPAQVRRIGSFKHARAHIISGKPVLGNVETTPLNLAVVLGRHETVTTLITTGADVNAADFWWGDTPLLLAVGKGDLPLIRMLIAAGAEVNPTAGGSTPLHYAFRYGKTGAARVLTEAGADVNRRDSQGMLPRPWALSVRWKPWVLLEDSGRPCFEAFEGRHELKQYSSEETTETGR